jgi:hypothetical protein
MYQFHLWFYFRLWNKNDLLVVNGVDYLAASRILSNLLTYKSYLLQFVLQRWNPTSALEIGLNYN